jgi:LemA protein
MCSPNRLVAYAAGAIRTFRNEGRRTGARSQDLRDPRAYGEAPHGSSVARRHTMKTMGRTGVVTLSILAVLVLLGGTCVATYNKLVRLDQATAAQWAQVENTYQRRADLVPNLVATVKGAAAFEQKTITDVTEARSRVGQVAPAKSVSTDRDALQHYQQAQEQLGGALSRLLVVAEAYPALTATQAFRDLQAQLEGTENRITVERMRYNEAARDFDTARASFPTSLVVGVFGARFPERQYFTAKAGSDAAPEVKF